MGLDDWLQSGKWASWSAPNLDDAASRALEGVGGLFDENRRRAKRAARQGRERLEHVYEQTELPEKVEGVKDRASAVREKASAVAEKTLRFVKEKPAARIAKTGVQVKAGLTGFGAGYFFPDLDVLFWGIGGRGRWLAQSGLPVWGAERAARALLHDPVGGRLTEEKGAKWKARRELYQTVAAPLLTGFSAGLGVRLVQEALDTRGLPGRIVVGGQLMVWERAWMLGNGIWCFSMGKDLLMVTLGRAQSEKLGEMLERLRGQEPEEETEEEHGI